MVENKTKDNQNLFGRSEYMTSVILKGNENLIGKVIKAKINKSNRNTLFGNIEEISNKKVA